MDEIDQHKVGFVKAKDFLDSGLRLLNQATETIFFQTYIFSFDEVGHAFLKEMEKAVTRKVKVYLLVDAFGSSEITDEQVSWIRSLGIQFDFFNPLMSKGEGFIGRRIHHKVIVCDQSYALIGGINTGEKFLTWLDYAVFLDGPLCKDLERSCRSLHFKQKHLRSRMKSEKINLLVNDWLLSRNEVDSFYKKRVASAKKEITLLGSYFFPGPRFLSLLKKARKRGVQVTLILTQESDFASLKWAERYLYQKLLRVGVKVYEYKKTVLHGKVGLFDGEWVTLGSYNINFISRYGDVETNISVCHQGLYDRVYQELWQVKEKDCLDVSSLYTGTKLGAKLKAVFFYYLIFIFQALLKLVLPQSRRD